MILRWVRRAWAVVDRFITRAIEDKRGYVERDRSRDWDGEQW